MEHRTQYWIFGPLEDAAFVLLTPLPILLAFTTARGTGTMNILIAFGLALAMAHYFPGILRAYGDRALFKRYRIRLVLAPLFLITLTSYFAYRNLHIVLLLALLWGQWHWMMQIYGFARIYDAKARPMARTPALLDRMICLLWFGMCAFVVNNDLPSYVASFYQSGGPHLPAEAFAWFTRAWVVLTAGVTVVYVIHMWTTIRSGQWPNPLKFVFIGVTFIYLSHTAGVVERPYMGMIMFESWHDIQYLAIVWLFNLSRARNNPEAGSFIRFMFRPRALLVLAYVVLCLAFGSLTHAWRFFDNAIAARVALSFVTSMGLLHYYLDGFIWKIREPETRRALLDEASQSVSTAVTAAVPRLPVLRHAVLWLLFAIPAVLFFVKESSGDAARPMQVYEDVLLGFPDSADAHYQLARELQDAGRFREATAHFEDALKFKPNMLPAHIFAGVLLTDRKEFAAAKLHFEQALRLDPRNAEVHNDLGIVLDEGGDLQGAKTHLERAVRFDPEYALAHNNLAGVLTRLGDSSGAAKHFKQANRLDPEHFH